MSKNPLRANSIPADALSRWNEQSIAMLGTMSDQQVALKLGITDTAVQQKRVYLGIPPFGRSREHSKHAWTKEELLLLGKEPDSQIARKVGVDPTVVAAKRRQLKIQPANGRAERRRVWTKRELAKLGTMSDVEFSKTFQISRRAVKEKRAELGIDAFNPYPDQLLWLAKWDKLLGKKPDSTVASTIGVTKERVRRRRIMLGVPSCDPKLATRLTWTKEVLKDLMRLSDRDFADKYNVSVNTARYRRARLAQHASPASK